MPNNQLNLQGFPSQMANGSNEQPSPELGELIKLLLPILLQQIMSQNGALPSPGGASLAGPLTGQLAGSLAGQSVGPSLLDLLGIQGRQFGGPMSAGNLYRVGERGPETIYPQIGWPYTVGQRGPQIMQPGANATVVPNAISQLSRFLGQLQPQKPFSFGMNTRPSIGNLLPYSGNYRSNPNLSNFL